MQNEWEKSGPMPARCADMVLQLNTHKAKTGATGLNFTGFLPYRAAKVCV